MKIIVLIANSGIWGMLLNLPMPLFPHLSEDNYSIYLIGLL